MKGEKRTLGWLPPPRPPKVAPKAPESLPAYLAVDTAAAIGAWTVGIQLPLSDVDVLTIGLWGRRRPDVGALMICILVNSTFG